MLLSVLIPAYNECLFKENIPHELLVVNDNSSDDTELVLEELAKSICTLRHITNHAPHNGFGFAVRMGLEHYKGDCVAIVMADLSDDPADLVLFYRNMVAEDLDCVFGSRFMKDSSVHDYPR